MQKITNIKQIIGIFLIYFLLVWNQTSISSLYLQKYTIPVTIVFFLLLYTKSRWLSKWCAICCLVLFGFMIVLRYSVGGIGIESYFAMISLIVITAYAVAYNKDDFLLLFLKVVVFMATISILLWLFCLAFPEIYEAITPTYETQMTYKIYSDRNVFDEYSYKASGLFLYVMREVDKRNTGIYTEPGVYQMVLNSALFILLMLDKHIKNISIKQRKKYFVILVATILTTQSTTGYIGVCLILFFYLFGEKEVIKRNVFMAALSVVLVLVLDYYFRADESLVNVAILDKLINDSNQISISANGSGLARWGTIVTSIQSIIGNPLGVGYDKFAVMLNVEETGYVAAAILSFGAVWGLIPLVFVLWWNFYPIMKFEISKKSKFLFVLLYLNTCLAQSSIFYPSLIAIPLCLFLDRKATLLNKDFDNMQAIRGNKGESITN